MSESKKIDIETELPMLSQMDEILNKIKNNDVTINPKISADFKDARILASELHTIEFCIDYGLEIESIRTHNIVRAYYGLLLRGAITININHKKYEELQKENGELKIELEKEKKLRYMADGRLAEYRRRYEDDYNDESFVGGVVDV